MHACIYAVQSETLFIINSAGTARIAIELFTEVKFGTTNNISNKFSSDRNRKHRYSCFVLLVFKTVQTDKEPWYKWQTSYHKQQVYLTYEGCMINLWTCVTFLLLAYGFSCNVQNNACIIIMYLT